MPPTNRLPPPWIETRADKHRRYVLHLERLYTSGLNGCDSHGAASRGRHLSTTECAAIEAQMRRDGKL